MQGRSADQLDQRFDRLISRGRDVVNGVAGGRPGSRATTAAGTREGERRNGWRNELDGLGRWVENRLDRLLEGEADWREPWQEDGGPAEPRGPVASSLPTSPPPARSTRGRPGALRSGPEGPAPGRRPLEAISRRGLGTIEATTTMAAPPRRAAQEPAAPVEPSGEPARGLVDQAQDTWPDDALFSVPRWSRPIRSGVGGGAAAPAAESPTALRSGDLQPDPETESQSRPLPRSSRRRSP
jgi:hypothetical protein